MVNVSSVLSATEEKMSAAGIAPLASFVSPDINGKATREAVRAAFRSRGYAALATSHIPNVTPEQALRKCITQSKPSAHLTCKVFENPNNSRLAFGVYYTPSEDGAETVASEKGDKLVLGARVRVNPESNSVEFLPPEGKDVGHAGCMRYAQGIATKASNLVKYCETSDITSALTAVLETFSALKMSQHGRGHIILPQYLSRWNGLLSALAPFGVRGRALSLWDLPDHKAETKEAARDSFIDAIKELRQKCADMAAKAGANKRGPRSDSLDNALCECSNLLTTARMYGDILGDLSSSIETEVSKLRKHFERLASGATIAYNSDDVNASTTLDVPAFDAEQVAAEMGLAPEDRVIPSDTSASEI